MQLKLVKPRSNPNETLIDHLEALLVLARSGKIDGLAYVCRIDAHDHRAGLAGQYNDKRAGALAAVLLLERHICKQLRPTAVLAGVALARPPPSCKKSLYFDVLPPEQMTEA